MSIGVVATVRDENQILIGAWCDARLVAAMDAARKHVRRSDFVRQAIAEKLRDLGVSVDESATVPRDRSQKISCPAPNVSAAALNEVDSEAEEPPDPMVDAAEEALLRAAVAEVKPPCRTRAPAARPSAKAAAPAGGAGKKSIPAS